MTPSFIGDLAPLLGLGLGLYAMMKGKEQKTMKASNALAAVVKFMNAASEIAETLSESIDRIEELEMRASSHKAEVADLYKKLDAANTTIRELTDKLAEAESGRAIYKSMAEEAVEKREKRRRR